MARQRNLEKGFSFFEGERLSRGVSSEIRIEYRPCVGILRAMCVVFENVQPVNRDESALGVNRNDRRQSMSGLSNEHQKFMEERVG